MPVSKYVVNKMLRVYSSLSIIENFGLDFLKQNIVPIKQITLHPDKTQCPFLFGFDVSKLLGNVSIYSFN